MSIISMNYQSRALMRNVHALVILPHQEMHPERCAPMPWKTLYLLHGYTENAEQLAYTLHLDSISSEYGIAIVIPDGENSFYVNAPARNANYETYIAEELVETTRMLFPLSDKYADTWIGGCSMGGFGALMLGLRHRNTFSKIVSFCPACNPYGQIGGKRFPKTMLDEIFQNENYYMENYDPFQLFLQCHQKKEMIPPLFICCGEDDPLVHDMCEDFVSRISNINCSYVYRKYPGGHTPEFVNLALPDAISFLL